MLLAEIRCALRRDQMSLADAHMHTRTLQSSFCHFPPNAPTIPSDDLHMQAVHKYEKRRSATIIDEPLERSSAGSFETCRHSVQRRTDAIAVSCKGVRARTSFCNCDRCTLGLCPSMYSHYASKMPCLLICFAPSEPPDARVQMQNLRQRPFAGSAIS